MTTMTQIMCLVSFSVAMSIEARAQNAPMIGVDTNYALDMATHNRVWKDRSLPVDPLALFAKGGCRNARIRLWVGDDGINRLKIRHRDRASSTISPVLSRIL